MPRNSITKDELKCRVLKLKRELNFNHPDKTGEWHRGAHYEINRVLEILDEYRF